MWENWQPTLETNCTAEQIQHEGQCFTIEVAFDHVIKYWSDQGKTVTGILYGVPAWAREESTCTAANADLAKFCSACNADDYARFVGMIAKRYNGLNGNGRISDFVIHNEVNMNQWYKVECGGGIPCDQEKWIADYAAIDYRRRKGFRITVVGDVANVQMIHFYKDNVRQKILLNENVNIDDTTVIDASFHRYVISNWDKLLDGKTVRVKSVSYTHLTLPTIYSV